MTIFDVLTLIGGLCLFLFGMTVMGDGLERRVGNSLKALLSKLTSSKMMGFLTGLGVTAVIQSSSATTVMVVGFVNSKIMTLKQSIGVIMGANIGTTVTAWILSLGGISGDNLIVQLLKPTSFTPILALIGTIYLMFARSDKKKDTGTILLGFATLMFGMDAMSGVLEKIAYLIVPEGKEAEKFVELDERLLATPTIALQQCGQLAVKMAEETVEGFLLSLQSPSQYEESAARKIRELEGSTDHYEDILGTYLTRIARCQISEDDSSEVSRLLKAIGDFERISDHSVNVLESVEEMKEKKISFSAEGKAEMDVLCAALAEILEVTMDAFRTGDLEKVYAVEPLEQVIDRLKSDLRNRHIARLKNGECSVEAGFVWSDLLTDLERTSDHCSNIALSILDAHAHNMNAHQSLQAMLEGNPVFVEKLENCSRKYVLPRG